MIVGRDTECLDETGVAKAAIETVAENTSDGVIAPMIFTAIGGPILGFFYKAVNTMDSMVGYKNDRYLYFGRTAAKLDDIVNYIPARISALLMVVSCFLCGKEFDGKRAWYILREIATDMRAQFGTDGSGVCRSPWNQACGKCKLFWQNRGKALYRGCRKSSGDRGY